MKTGWVIVIALLTLVLGFIGGAMVGSAGGVLGGGLAGVCYTADVAVKEGLLTEEQKASLLQSLMSKHPELANKLEVKGDLSTLCKDLLSQKP
jgi:hypothetical protein